MEERIMTVTRDLWCRVLTDGKFLRGQPVRVVEGRLRDESFQRCLSRLRASGASLQTQFGAGARHGGAMLLLGAPEHTLSAFDSLRLARAPAGGAQRCPPNASLRCLALAQHDAAHAEMNAWLEFAQAGATYLWHHSMVFTNDTIDARVVTGVGMGLNLRLQRDDAGLVLTVRP